MRGREWAMLSILFAWVCWFSPAALAAEPEVALSPISYAGDIPDYFRREIEQTLREALKSAHGTVSEMPRDACSEPGCDAATVVISARVVERARDYHVALFAHAVEDAAVLASVEATCNVCGQRELLDALPAYVNELNAKLVEALAARVRAPRLVIEGSPDGAGLRLDGRDVGSSPTAVEVSVGEHELEISAPQHASQLHRWFAVAGVEELVTYELAPTAASMLRGPQVAGWLMTSLGIVGLGSGVTLWVLDGREHAPSCSPELVDINGACPNVYTTATAGYVSLGLGVAALAVGVGLLVHAQRRRSKSRRVGMTLDGLALQF